MKLFFTIAAIVVFSCLSFCSNAQNTRINDRNTIGWFAHLGNWKLNNKWSVHTEYQWRREDVVTEWQQSLLRLGMNYQLSPKVQLRAGYAWIETFNYGDFPIQAAGKTFTEHRIWQMATVTDKVGRVDMSHRFLLEQRWIGRFTDPASVKEDEFFYVNRIRYMYRMQIPLKGNTLDNKEPYVAAYDEILMGFGKNVNENVFDQNRLGVLVGYRFSPLFRIEGGYFNQIVQLPREVNGRNVFQYNTGFILNTYLNVDLSKRKKKS
jgi:Protein of unknown function (DUF2490)